MELPRLKVERCSMSKRIFHVTMLIRFLTWLLNGARPGSAATSAATQKEQR